MERGQERPFDPPGLGWAPLGLDEFKRSIWTSGNKIDAVITNMLAIDTEIQCFLAFDMREFAGPHAQIQITRNPRLEFRVVTTPAVLLGNGSVFIHHLACA